jgi:hypothetical protein
VAEIVQRDLSAGMFRSTARELIPSRGVYDIENGLLDENGAVYKRGGAEFLAASWATASPLTSIFSGRLTNGVRVVIADSGDFRSYDPATWGVLHTGGALAAGQSWRPVVFKGTLIAFAGVTYDGSGFNLVSGFGGVNYDYYATVAGRLVGANTGGDVVAFSGVDSWTFAPTDFHRIPGVAVFTTNGVWIISGLSQNLTDADGNVQHRVDLFSRDLILWHNAGIASWRGSIVVPARDGVWLMQAGVTSEPAVPFEKISGPIDRLYRDRLAAGGGLGVATVHRGHLFLPMIGVGEETLVCRLDVPGRPWVRLAGHAGLVAGFAEHKEDSGVALLAATRETSAGRLMRCSFFDSTAETTDADGSVPSFSVTSRDLPTGSGPENTITKLRAAYTLQSAGTADLTASLENPTTTALTGSAPETAEADTYSWRVGKRRRFARVKIACNDETTDLTLRSIELFTRDSGLR